jgi:hypothetical protein
MMDVSCTHCCQKDKINWIELNWSKSHTQVSTILVTNVQNLVNVATWCPGFVHPWLFMYTETKRNSENISHISNIDIAISLTCGMSHDNTADLWIQYVSELQIFMFY